jgi:tetratricopeptide (TPR) repeat protein
MQRPLDSAIELQEMARSSRKKGDALRKVGREEAATEAYATGIKALNDALDLLKTKDQALQVQTSPVPEDLLPDLHELVEIYGALGGMYQRLGTLDKSLSNYRAGASLEDRFGLASTYNRLNAVKYSLLTGAGSLQSFEGDLEALANFIDVRLRSDKSLSDRGWAWADLGDCFALLGRIAEAAKAYATFVAKAEIKSPERSLDVLKEIAAKLNSEKDPDASRLTTAITALQAALVQ